MHHAMQFLSDNAAAVHPRIWAALQAADAFRLAGLSALLIDTSAQPGDASRLMAERMGATCVPLPHAGAAGLSQAVLLAQPRG